jgi:hypothetical protein
MSFQTSFTFGVLVSVAVPAISWAATLAASARIDRRRVRRAIHLADRRIAILAPRKAAALEAALRVYLHTPTGKAVAADPRIARRLELFAALTRARNFDRQLRLRRNAEADLLLAPLYEAA